jgi:hypothetical protein
MGAINHQVAITVTEIEDMKPGAELLQSAGTLLKQMKAAAEEITFTPEELAMQLQLDAKKARKEELLRKVEETKKKLVPVIQQSARIEIDRYNESVPKSKRINTITVGGIEVAFRSTAEKISVKKAEEVIKWLRERRLGSLVKVTETVPASACNSIAAALAKLSTEELEEAGFSHTPKGETCSIKLAD